MQTSGNNTRNVTSDQWAGVAPGEIEDPRIWSELLRQYTTLHPESRSCHASSNSPSRRSDHDRRGDQGARYRPAPAQERARRNRLRGAGGGGLGRTPFIGKTIKPFVHGHNLLSYVEAILRVYNQ